MGMPAAKMTLVEFIEWENAQVERHEFYRGEVFAMVGPKRSHGTVVGNLGAELRSRLKGTPCRAFAESMKMQIGDDTLLYPDIFVTCDRADLRSEYVFRSPLLIVEVLSPTTKDFDKGRKFAHYRQLASLREYLLIDPETRDVHAFRRNAADEWVLHDMTDSDALVLPCIDATIPMAEIFDGVDPAP